MGEILIPLKSNKDRICGHTLQLSWSIAEDNRNRKKKKKLGLQLFSRPYSVKCESSENTKKKKS